MKNPPPFSRFKNDGNEVYKTNNPDENCTPEELCQWTCQTCLSLTDDVNSSKFDIIAGDKSCITNDNEHILKWLTGFNGILKDQKSVPHYLKSERLKCQILKKVIEKMDANSIEYNVRKYEQFAKYEIATILGEQQSKNVYNQDVDWQKLSFIGSNDCPVIKKLQQNSSTIHNLRKVYPGHVESAIVRLSQLGGQDIDSVPNNNLNNSNNSCIPLNQELNGNKEYVNKRQFNQNSSNYNRNVAIASSYSFPRPNVNAFIYKDHIIEHKGSVGVSAELWNDNPTSKPFGFTKYGDYKMGIDCGYRRSMHLAYKAEDFVYDTTNTPNLPFDYYSKLQRNEEVCLYKCQNNNYDIDILNNNKVMKNENVCNNKSQVKNISYVSGSQSAFHKTIDVHHQVKSRRKQTKPLKSVPRSNADFRGVTIQLKTQMRRKDDPYLTLKPYFSSRRLRKIYEGKAKQRKLESRKNEYKRHAKITFHHSSHRVVKGRGKQCSSCGTKKTPLWRDTDVGVPLCNACGIRYKKYRVSCSKCCFIPKKSENMCTVCSKCGGKLRSQLQRNQLRF